MAYPRPTDEDGNELGAPPNSEWDEEEGRWRTLPVREEEKPNLIQPTISQAANPFGSSAPAPTDIAQSAMIERDKGSWEARLREEAAKVNVSYDPSDLQGIMNFASYAANAGRDPGEAINRMIENYRQRSSNMPTPDRSAPRGGSGPSAGVPTTAGWLPSAPSSFTYQFNQDPNIAKALESQNALIKQMFESQAGREAQARERQSGLYEQLRQRATQSLDIDPNSPIIKQQVEAFGAQQERARRNYLSDLAEEAGPYANLRGERRMASERAGQAIGGLQAELMGRELTSRRNEIAQSLASMAGLLSADQEAALRQQLGLLDNAIAQQQVGLGRMGTETDLMRALMQNQQFWGDLGLRAEDQYSRWNDPYRFMSYR